MKTLTTTEISAVNGGGGPLREVGREVGEALRDIWDWITE